MTRGPKKHLKRINAPSKWMLDKLGGIYAPRPSPGPHKLQESLPLVLLLRNKLKYALTGRETTSILMQRLVKVDGKVRTDKTFPTGFQDVVSIEKTGEHFRIMYDTKGRFVVHKITDEESKICAVRKVAVGPRSVPYIVTHDGRTIRYPDPLIKVNDSVKVDIATGKAVEHYKFEVGHVCTITGGRNIGRVGIVQNRERHPGSFDIVHVKDKTGHQFATRLSNVFILGNTASPAVSLPKGKGVKLSIIEEASHRHN